MYISSFFYFNAEFPPFQRHIMENKICETVELVARNDTEAYVKASALKVLASMIKIQRFWDHSLHQLDVKVSINYDIYIESNFQ